MWTPSGGDYQTCPLCGQEDSDEEPGYCASCKIVYTTGCTHGVHGCTDNSYYGKIVVSFKLNGQTHEGMPIFYSYQDYLDTKMELTWKCMCNNKTYNCKGSKYNQKYQVSKTCESLDK
jgi:hypothetical protein